MSQHPDPAADAPPDAPQPSRPAGGPTADGRRLAPAAPDGPAPGHPGQRVRGAAGAGPGVRRRHAGPLHPGPGPGVAAPERPGRHPGQRHPAVHPPRQLRPRAAGHPRPAGQRVQQRGGGTEGGAGAPRSPAHPGRYGARQGPRDPDDDRRPGQQGHRPRDARRAGGAARRRRGGGADQRFPGGGELLLRAGRQRRCRSTAPRCTRRTASSRSGTRRRWAPRWRSPAGSPRPSGGCGATVRVAQDQSMVIDALQSPRPPRYARPVPAPTPTQ